MAVMSSVPPPNDVRAQIQGLRNKLLDLTLNNRMLNYRPSKRLGVSIIGEDSFELHRMLVDEGKKMTFVGKPDPVKLKPSQPTLSDVTDYSDDISMGRHREAAQEELDAFLNNPILPLSQQDTKLNVDEYESLLQAKLRTVYREAHLASEELGINTLFLTLGCLEWSENDQRSFIAPLLFVPVDLEQQNNGTIKLKHSGSDVGTNLPLKTKLLEFNLNLPDLSEEASLLDYFAQVEAVVRDRTNWHIRRNEVCMGFFNYEKYAMYLDLGGESWPENAKPWMQADITAMLGGGYSSADSPVNETTYLDSVRPISQSFEVYDADSSQTLAMIRATEGLSIVVEGPPGTGKSQTITNMIAEAVASKKTVLFVSAKRAALDVVIRRLDEAELGDMCLDLHDKLTNRREFYREIKRTVDRSLTISNESERLHRLAEIRDRLNRHSSAMNEPIVPFGISPFEAMIRASSLPAESSDDRDGRIPFENLKSLDHQEFLKRIPAINAVQARIQAIGTPRSHPFFGCNLDYLDPSAKLDLTLDLDECLTNFSALHPILDEFKNAVKLPSPTCQSEVRLLGKLIDTAMSYPLGDKYHIQARDWLHHRDLICKLIKNATTSREIYSHLRNDFTSDAWKFDLRPIREVFVHRASSFVQRLLPEFRTASRTLDQHLTVNASKDPLKRLELLNEFCECQTCRQAIQASESSLEPLLADLWNDGNPDPQAVVSVLDWLLHLESQVQAGTLGDSIWDLLEQGVDKSLLTHHFSAISQAVDLTMDSHLEVCKKLIFATDSVAHEEFGDIQNRVAKWRKSIDSIGGYISFNQVSKQLSDVGLACITPIAEQWSFAADRLEESVKRSYYTGIIRIAVTSKPELKNFDRAIQESAVTEFAKLDDFKLLFNRAAVRMAHHKGLPTFELPVGNLNHLRIQCELQRKHKPIRWIMERAGEAIQKIKPVFMMSPLSVAIHLPPELPPFDLVIFDEASQIRPEDALCAIARAKQVIVVGDTRQMPPTSFFDRMIDDEVGDEEEFTEIGSEARKVESILSLMSAVALGRVRRPDLRWHYRSIHPSLIQPSNEMFYDRRLVVFPSATVEQNGQKLGLVLHHLPDAIYESGASKRINRHEAEVIAKAVYSHLKESPQESLLVAAMNKPQADLIYEEVQKLERQDPISFSAFERLHPHEKLDIKNLENVQGDERDVVFISVTYGKDSSGVLRQQFGPLLREGGERRLNVLITRARKRSEVFTSILSDDLRNESNRAGVDALKRFLKFAQTGSMQIATLTNREAESPFEEEVAQELSRRGYGFDLQVGFEGFRIDLAVIDPEHPGSYLLGIECDGATYHSARAARDRDKLRQRILEDRGWKLHRIWSHDWWQDKAGEIQRLIEVIEDAKNPTVDIPPKAPAIKDDESQEFIREIDPGDSSRFLRPYEAAPSPTQLTSRFEFEQFVDVVIHTEGPIHQDLLSLRIKEAGGKARLTNADKAMLKSLLDGAKKKYLFTVDGYFADQSQLVNPRDWSNRPTSERRFEFVTEMEIAAGMRHVVRNAFGIEPEEAARSALALMGFKRITPNALARGLSVVHRMISAGGIIESEGRLYPPVRA